MLERVVAVIGPPAVGKTTLTLRLAGQSGIEVFRLREHVPDAILAATATSSERIGWIDDPTVMSALHGYVDRVIFEGTAHTVLLDNFPGSGTQVRLLLGTLHRLIPECAVYAAELLASPEVREHRMLGRRVCHQCEQDPIRDPRKPATASHEDPERCARCGGLLHPRRGDAPRLFDLRAQRYADEAVGIRAVFAEAGIEVMQLDSHCSMDVLAARLTALLVHGHLSPGMHPAHIAPYIPVMGRTACHRQAGVMFHRTESPP
jgi:adenylate kinase